MVALLAPWWCVEITPGRGSGAQAATFRATVLAAAGWRRQDSYLTRPG
ncbi:MAG TPA: hypothetical protein VLP43_00015 [Solirubrobacteraceae bacterium]|nr:hypothetical protein [Solirubrobacteraceae bacterium]